MEPNTWNGVSMSYEMLKNWQTGSVSLESFHVLPRSYEIAKPWSNTLMR